LVFSQQVINNYGSLVGLPLAQAVTPKWQLLSSVYEQRIALASNPGAAQGLEWTCGWIYRKQNYNHLGKRQNKIKPIQFLNNTILGTSQNNSISYHIWLVAETVKNLRKMRHSYVSRALCYPDLMSTRQRVLCYQG